jgi:hypothetical protein
VLCDFTLYEVVEHAYLKAPDVLNLVEVINEVTPLFRNKIKRYLILCYFFGMPLLAGIDTEKVDYGGGIVLL